MGVLPPPTFVKNLSIKIPTFDGGPVDQPGNEEEHSSQQIGHPLGMREVAGSNPARSTILKSFIAPLA